MSYPRSKDEWWELEYKYWPELFSIMARFLPLGGYEAIDGSTLEELLAEKIIRLHRDKNSDIVRYFNAAWAAAPDIPEIHNIPGWGVLCDLCAEESVLYEEGADDG